MKKFQSVTGINLTSRQKSTGPFKRSGLAESIMLEAAIDDKLATIGVSDEAIRKNKVEVMAMLMKMYNLSYADMPKEEFQKLTPEENKTLRNIAKEMDLALGKSRVGEPEVSSDVEKVKRDIGISSTLKTALSRINNYDEFEALILGMAAMVNPNLAKAKQDIKSALFSLSNKVKAMKEESETPSDVDGVYKVIDTLKTLKSHLEQINTRDEFADLIFSLLPYIDPKGQITKDKNKLASAIMAASNRSSLKDPKPIDLDKLGR